MKTKIFLSTLAITTILLLGFLSFFLAGDISEWITGRTTTTRAFILESHPINCTVNLTRGINYVSFPCETAQVPFDQAFKNENNEALNYKYVFVFKPLQTKKPWSSYNPSLPNWTIQEDLNRIDRRTGYAIYMEEPGTYHAEGLRFPITNTQLRKGWNLVGYPSTNTKTIQEVTATISQEYESIHSYQDVGGTKTWLHHKKGEGGTLTHFKPGYAYWIKMNEDATWRVEW